VQGAFVGLVDDHDRVRGQVGLEQELAQQHAVRHVLDDCVGGCVVVETNSVPDLLAQLHLHFFAHTFSDAHCRYSSRLSAAYLALLCVPVFVEELGQLGRLARSCLADHYDHLVVADQLHQLLPEFEDRQRFLDQLHGGFLHRNLLS
jgi:hypothetical protein